MFRCLGVQGFRVYGGEENFMKPFLGKCHWMKKILDENVTGRNRFWMKLSWVKLSIVLDESVFWTKVFLDESGFGRVFFFLLIG